MNSYLLFKSLHLIAIISWMAGLLYLPRIFVYHVENIDHKISSSIFKTMEKKLFSVTLLTLYHFYLSKFLNDFKFDQNTKSSKFFRIINEVPTILLILVVFIVIFKPI